MKRFLLILMAIMFAVSGWTQTTVTIGSGTSTSSSGTIPGYYGFHNSAMLFKASEMSQSGTIQSFGLEISTSSTTSTRSMKIYLKEVSDTSLASSQIMNNLLDGAVLVYDSANVNCSSTGWRDFVFSTPFNYSGTNSLLVIVTGSGCTTSGGCAVDVKYSSTPSDKAWTKVIDGSNINYSTLTSNTNRYRYNSRFSISSLPTDFCYPPLNLIVNNISHFSANLSWTANTSISSWIIEYKPTSSTTWTSDVSSTNSFSFVGLDAGTSYNVRVKSNCTSSSNESTWITTTFSTPLSCPAPSAIVVPSSNIGLNEGLVTWNPISNPATWNEGYLIQYKPQSIEDWNLATSISAIQDTFYLIQGLTPSTLYNVRIKSVCNPGLDSSTWVTSSFRTSCEAVISNLPWIESFEENWNSSFVAPGNKAAPYCWLNIDSLNTSTYYWQTSSTAKFGNKAAYMYGASAASTSTTLTNRNNDWLISPVITLTGNERLNFWAKKSSTTYYPDLLVYAMDVSQGDLNSTASNANFVLVGSLDTLIMTTTYAQFEYNLSSLTGNYRFAFVRKKMASGSVYIDGVKVSAIPTCFPPTGLVSSNITSDQAGISWTPASGSDANWNLYLKNTSSNTTDVIPVTGNMHTLTNLTPNTIYYGVLLTDCGNGTQSDSSSSIIFRTNCIPSTVPFSENFNTSVITEPTCWTRFTGLLAETSVLTPTTSGWSYNTNIDTSMTINIYGNSCKYWLASPTIDLGQDGSLYQLDFDAVYADLLAGTGNPTHSPDDKFAVVVSTDNGLTWSSANATIWYASADSTYSLTSFTPTTTHISLKLQDHDLNPYQGLIKIALYGESLVTLTGADNYLLIDNFNVDLAPVCPEVFNTTAIAATFTSAQINFATDNAEEGTSWEIAYAETSDPTSFNPDAVTPINVNSASELPYNITGLNPDSTYYISVRQNCGGNWSPAVSVTLPQFEPTSTLPYAQNFDNLTNISEWTINNPGTNKWYIGSVVPSPIGTGNTLYISKDSISNDYAHTASYSYAHTLLNFGAATEFMVSFDWKSGGESTYDYVRVYLLPIDMAVPTSGLPSGYEISGILNLQSSWQNFNTVLSGNEYSNTIKRLLFVWKNDGGGGIQPAIAIDNITVSGMACTHPSNLIVDNLSITQTEATLSWIENGTATSWLVEYSADGINWMSEIANTNTNFVLTGLTHSTPYIVRVKSSCNSTDYSAPSEVVNFATLCGTINVPYVQNFDNYGTGTPILPRCWSRLNTQSTVLPYISSTNYSGVGSLYFSADSAKYNIAILPEMDASVSINGLQLTLYYRKVNANSNLIVGVMSDPTDISTFDSVTTITASAVSQWELKEISLSSYQGAGRYIAFKNAGIVSKSGYIDNLKVDLIPTCPNTYALSSSFSSYNKVILNWNSLTYAGQGYEISYSPVATGFDPNTGTIMAVADNTTMTPYELTGLTPSTSYSFAVRQACGGQWSNIITVATTAPPVQIPYVCDFEDLNENSSWVISNSTTSNKWVIGSAVNSGLITGHSLYVSNDNGVSNAYSTSSTNTIVASRLIEFDGSDAYSLSFNSRVGGEGTTTPYDYFKVYLVNEDTNYVGINSTPYYGGYTYSQGALLLDGVHPYFLNPSNANNINSHSVQIPNQGIAGTVKRLVFVWSNDGSGGTQPPVSIDNISITALNCPAPQLTTANITQNDIELSWNVSSNDSGWQIYWKEASATNYDSVYTNTPPPYILNGLNLNTAYNIYIKSDCGTDYSNPSNIINIRTLCDAITQFPYSENFDTYGTASGAFPYCWFRPVLNTTTPYPSIVTANAYSSPANLKFQSASASAPTYAITPQLDADINNLRVKFMLKAENTTSSGKILVGVMSNPTDTSTFELVQTIQPTSTDYTQYEIAFNNTALTGNGNYIAFKHVTVLSNYYYWLDNLVVDYIPACAKPTMLTSSNITTTSADISWTPGHSTDNTWWLYYKESSVTEYDSVPVTGSSSYSFTTLNAGIAYNVYIKTDCGTELSEATNVFTFRTSCGIISSLPWRDSFDSYGTGTSIFPTCWSRINTYTSANPYINATSYSAPGALYFYTTAAYKNIAVTPEFDALIPINTLKASFMYRTSNSTDRLIIGVMTNPTDSTTFDSITTVRNSATGTWEFKEVNFASYTGIGQYIAFKNQNSVSSVGYIDDLEISLAPSCPNTYFLNTVSSTTNNVTLDWYDDNSSNQGWVISYGTVGTGFDPSSGIIVSIPVGQNPPYTLTGLTPGTPYSFAVRQACGGAWSNIVAINTIGLPAQLPYTCDFEDVNEQNSWTISNGTATNKWFIGTAVSANPITGNSLYISNNNGISNQYDANSYSTVVASRLIEFNGSNSYNLTFNSRVGGEHTFDYIKVFLVNPDTTFVGKAATSDATQPYFCLTTYSTGAILFDTNTYFDSELNPTIVNSHSIILPSQGVAGTIKKLIFVWKNDGNSGTQPPASIDNISITPITSCPEPTAITVTNQTNTTADVSWTAGGTETAWQVRLSETGTPIDVTNTSYPLTGLIQGTSYNVYVRANCGGTYSSWVSQTFSTTGYLAPTITTVQQTGITQTSATLNGSYEQGTNTISIKGFQWKLVSASTWTTQPVTVGTTPFTYLLNGLTANTQYEFRAYVETSVDTTYGTTLQFTTLAVVPTTVVTSAASLVAQTTATLNGTVTLGSENITAQGFEWKETSATTWTVQPAAGTTITHTLSSLTPNTSYTYRAFAMTATDTVRGIDINFNTLAIVAPIVVTSPASNLSQTSADLNGTVTAGSEQLTAQGFEWRLVGTTTWNNVNATLTANAMTHNLTGLTANTSYEYRAYITTTTTTYGSIIPFTTLQNVVTPPSVLTSPATNITQTSADLNGTVTQGTNPLLTQGFQWRLANATSWTPVPVTLVGNAITYPLSNLTANTTYEFRAYAITSIDTTYGLTLNFTTLPIPVVLGDVITLGTMPIGDHSATLNGTLVNVGNAISNVKVGFVYSTMTNPMIGGANVITDTVPYTVGMTSFSKPIIGLQSNTNYFCKAYITNSAGTQYGLEETFITLGLVDPKVEGFTVSMYPNPATNTTKLVLSGVVEEAKIVISDVQGRIINTINAKSVSGEVEQIIDVNNLAKGVYYVRIQNSTTSKTQKLIVQ